jgi:hypothetical protein
MFLGLIGLALPFMFIAWAMGYNCLIGLLIPGFLALLLLGVSGYNNAAKKEQERTIIIEHKKKSKW